VAVRVGLVVRGRLAVARGSAPASTGGMVAALSGDLNGLDRAEAEAETPSFRRLRLVA
jgi:hypothetical protein